MGLALPAGMLGRYGLWVRRVIAGSALLGMSALGGGCRWEEESCPASQCDVYSEARCQGNVIRWCEGIGSFINDYGTSCTTGYVKTIDCGPDAQCFDGTSNEAHHARAPACVLPEEHCPTGARGVCRNDSKHDCIGDRIRSYGVRCSDWEGVSCVLVERDDGTTDGVCSLASAPCAPAEFSNECRGNTAVHCSEGYPLIETECPSDKPCAAGRCSDTGG